MMGTIIMLDISVINVMAQSSAMASTYHTIAELLAIASMTETLSMMIRVEVLKIYH